MKKIAFAVMSVFAVGGAVAAPDWSKAAPVKMTLFYPGQSSLEWVMDKAEHSAVPDIVEKKRTCAKCHTGDANEVGDKIVKGQPAGHKKASIEPKPIANKAGHIPVELQTAHDGSKIYFRLTWSSPKGGAAKQDNKNEVKATILFDGGGTVDSANLNGCWATCHDDLRSMKSAKDDKKTKYVKGADLASGNYYDLLQFKSGKGEKPVDGHVIDKRVMEGGKSLIKAEGKKDGDKWVVTFERELAGKAPGDHSIAAGKMYNFGVAIHEDYSNARYHYVSLGYQFALDEKGKEKNQISVVKQ
ncbi:MAG: ethylbenzene dehydrogenase-related protein [Rhodocyclaceae bacterium]|nr:ethylbenzene dehydrogenase-related protein [Rhodocyclaceae bacterium]MDZ4213609.1 ethylbenzene dehydrogenase-related protein [Rhodocyclaceae bacterium]